MLFPHISSIHFNPLNLPHLARSFPFFSVNATFTSSTPNRLTYSVSLSSTFTLPSLFSFFYVNLSHPLAHSSPITPILRFAISSQNPLHFQMAMQTVEAPASRLLYSLLMMNGWWDISVLLCQEWDISNFLVLIKNNTRFHLGTLVNLTTTASTMPQSSSPLSYSGAEASSSLSSLPYFSPAASSSASSSTSSAKSDQQQAVMRQLEALREPSSTTGVVTFGCEIREVRRLWTLATRMTLPEFHWVLGDSQNVAELRTEGLPLGLLAHGVMGSPSLDHYVHDSVELVARAVSYAAQQNPALALIPGTTNCMDVQQSNGSSGDYLAR